MHRALQGVLLGAAAGAVGAAAAGWSGAVLLGAVVAAYELAEAIRPESKQTKLPPLYVGTFDPVPGEPSRDTALKRLFWVTGHDRIRVRDGRMLWLRTDELEDGTMRSTYARVPRRMYDASP